MNEHEFKTSVSHQTQLQSQLTFFSQQQILCIVLLPFSHDFFVEKELLCNWDVHVFISKKSNYD